MGCEAENDAEYRIISTLLYIPDSTSYRNIKDPAELHPNDLLPYHHRRLLTAAHAHGFISAVSLLEQADFIEVLPEQILEHLRFQPNFSKHTAATDHVQHLAHHYRVRIAVSSGGEVTLISTQIAPATSPFIPRHLCFDASALPLCQIHVNPFPTTPSNFTRHKTTNRSMYETALADSGIGNDSCPLSHEVLLWNPDGLVMECSSSTVYFHRPPTNAEAGLPHSSWQTPPLSAGGCDSVTRTIALESRLCVEKVIRVEEVQIGEWVWLSNAVRGFWTGRIVDMPSCTGADEYTVELMEGLI